MSLINYIVKRILMMLPVLFGAITLGFFLCRFLPGDPVAAYMAANEIKVDPIAYANTIRLLGLDQPVIVQYFQYIGDLFMGNWGMSVTVSPGQDVWSLIWERLPRTIEITISSMLIASIIGIMTGVFSAKHRNKKRDTGIRFISLLGVAIPVFFLGLILQYFLGYQSKYLFGVPLFPSTGYKSSVFTDPPFFTGFRGFDSLISGNYLMFLDYAYHLFLPVLCLSFITLAGITRQSRSSLLEVLEQDYIRTARAKGCKERDVIYSHALKNSLIPTVTVIGLSFAGLLGGAVLTEATFSLTGMGNLFISALVKRDYWLINALIFVVTLFFVIANLFIDLIYSTLDPRIAYG